MSYNNGNHYYYGNGHQQAQYSSYPQNVRQHQGTYDQQSNLNELQALQMRLLQAKQANLLYKQSVVKNLILNKQVESQRQQQAYENNLQQQMQPYNHQENKPMSYLEQQAKRRDLQQQQKNSDGLNFSSTPPQLSLEQLDRELGLPSRDDFTSSKQSLRGQSSSRLETMQSNDTRKQQPPGELTPQPQSRGSNTNNTNSQRNSQNASTAGNTTQTTTTPPSEQRALRPQQQSQQQQPTLPQSSSNPDALHCRKKLQDLTDNMKKVHLDNQTTLDKTSSTTSAAQAENEKKEKKVARLENKERIENLLKHTESKPMRMPLWRHRFLKNDPLYNPPPELILKGKSLWRTIVTAMIGLYFKPMLVTNKRKLRMKDKQKADLLRNLLIYSETVGEWTGKLVQLPIASIIQDSTLDFDPKEQYNITSSNYVPLKTRMLQLKVRFKAICNSISTSNPATAIPQHLIEFFITLISDDNYFPPTFLYPFESSLFEHTKLGGTLNMLYQEDDSDTDKNISRHLLPYILTVEYNKHDSDSSDAGSVKAGDQQFNSTGSTSWTGVSSVNSGNDNGKAPTMSVEVNVARIRMLIVDFIFVRILINHLTLSPWFNKIGPSVPPSGRVAKRIIYNLRVLATALYSLAEAMNPQLPPVEKASNTATSIVASKSTASSSIHTESNSFASADSVKISSFHGSKSLEKQGSFSGMFQKLLDKTPKNAYDKVTVGSIEEILLNRRKTFTSLDELHVLLLNRQHMAPIKSIIDDWIEEFKGPLNAWVNKLICVILKNKFEKQQKSMGEGGEVR